MIVNSTELSKGLSFLYQAYKNKTTMPIMQNVKLSLVDGWLTMTQTDGDMELTHKIPAEGDNECFTVEMKKLKDRASQYAKDKSVSIIPDEEMKKVTVKCGRSKITLNALPPEEFPDTQEPSSFEDITVSGSELKRALSVVRNAQAQGDVRVFLNGVAMQFVSGSCDVVATDGHRLHNCSISADSKSDLLIIVPREAVSPVHKFLDAGDVVLRVSDGALRLSDEESTLQTKLKEGKYPDWKRIVPSANPVSAVFNKEDLSQAINGALVTSNEKYKGVMLSIESGSATFTSNAPDGSKSEEVIDCSCNDDVSIAFNGDYVVDSIAAIESDNVTILFKDSNSAALIKDGNYQAVVMPMRL